VDTELTAVPIRYDHQDGSVAFLLDVSERKRMEAEKIQADAQMRQRQKLEAIGTLAGGVAHEINNPVNGIMNYAQLILDELDRMQKPHDQLVQIEEYAQEILHETDRVSSIVRGLLQFSRQERQAHSLAAVEDILSHTVSLIRTIFRMDHIELDILIDKGLPQLKCRSQQIQQVLMNLLTNARDALNERYPGSYEDKIVYIRAGLFIEEGRRWIRITVEDHGAGIPDNIREKIFEPFFSTKPKEKGTGLGLSISFGIVQDHHGRLTVVSSPDSGTRFLMELPVDNGWTVESVREAADIDPESE
jgi:signal transduction histidine kinase